MKNNIIIFCLIIATAFSFTNCKNSNENKLNSKDTALLVLDTQISKTELSESEHYFYGIGSRFAAISKTDLENATTIYPFNSDDENERIAKINSTEIIIIENDRRTDKREHGDSENLTDAQKELFKSLDYSKHFSMKTLFEEKATEGKVLEERKYNPHYTITPEKQAVYIDGETALINYLIKNSRDQTANLDDNKVRAIKIYFTISKQGILKHVKRDRSTSFPELDKKLEELTNKIPGQWIPAENAKGEKVEQEFAFSFGNKRGC